MAVQSRHMKMQSLFIAIVLLSPGWPAADATADNRTATHNIDINREAPNPEVINTVEQQSIPLPSKRVMSCDCPPDFSNNALKCDPVLCEWELENGFWFGVSPEFNDTLVVSLCPTDFCYANKSGSSIYIPAATAIYESDSFLCGQQQRTGVICGECVDGYAPAINSATYECVRCTADDEKVNWLYYILAVYLPLFILFHLIIIFNIKLTSGPANAFILFAQVISTTVDPSADGQIPLNTFHQYPDRLLNGYRVPYGVFNLKFIANILPPFCLSRNLNSLDVIALNYVVATFPLVMILLVVVLYNCPCFQRIKIGSCMKFFRYREWRLANSLVDAFAAFILLSYTRFSLTSVYLLGQQPLWDQDGEVVGRRRLYFGGQFTGIDTIYILRYSIPARLVYGIFVAIPPIVLLEFPVRWLEKLILKVKWLRARYPFDKVNILLDTFQGCYRDNRRWFAGMYFILRIALNLTYQLTETWLLHYTIQQILFTLYIFLIAVLWPYKRNFINYVDIAIFVNMAILNSLSLYLVDFNVFLPDVELPLGPFVFQYILVFAPLFYMIGYVLWYLTQPCHKGIVEKTKRIFSWLTKNCLRQRGEQGGEVSGDNNASADQMPREDTMNRMLQRAAERNTYRYNNPRDGSDESVVVLSLVAIDPRPRSAYSADEHNRFSAFYYEAESPV